FRRKNYMQVRQRLKDRRRARLNVVSFEFSPRGFWKFETAGSADILSASVARAFLLPMNFSIYERAGVACRQDVCAPSNNSDDSGQRGGQRTKKIAPVARAKQVFAGAFRMRHQ